MKVLLSRLRSAWAAFKGGPSYCAGAGDIPMQKIAEHPLYAVIYDTPEYGRDEDPVECFYESFSSPEQAQEMFRTAYPIEHDAANNARLVLILGPIDDYAGRA